MIGSPLIWGLVLGLGSSLHCSGMCGPIGCTLLMITPGGGETRALVLRLATMQLGRITAYAALGTAFGAVGASLYSELELTEVHSAFQWIAASVVLWLGLGTAGWVPAMAGLDRALAPLAGRVARLRTSLSAAGAEAALVAGLAWGLTPCAMVYGAIFNSLLVGDALQGGIMMFFFGLGTVPAVTATALGLHQASRGSFRMGREWSGMLMVSGGAVGLLLTVPGSPLCISG